MNSLSQKKGFTIVEILLSLSIIAIVLAISAPVYSQFLIRNDLSLAGEAVLGSLRRAYNLSISGYQDDSWGVNIDNGGVILFRGTDFSGRDTSFDETQDFAPNMTVSGLQQTIFTKLSGLPTSNGTITITNTGGNSRDITINEEGTVQLQ